MTKTAVLLVLALLPASEAAGEQILLADFTNPTVFTYEDLLVWSGRVAPATIANVT